MLLTRDAPLYLDASAVPPRLAVEGAGVGQQEGGGLGVVGHEDLVKVEDGLGAPWEEKRRGWPWLTGPIRHQVTHGKAEIKRGHFDREDWHSGR